MSHPKPAESNEGVESIDLTPEELERIAQLCANPPRPSEQLRAAARRQWPQSR